MREVHQPSGSAPNRAQHTADELLDALRAPAAATLPDEGPGRVSSDIDRESPGAEVVERPGEPRERDSGAEATSPGETATRRGIAGSDDGPNVKSDADPSCRATDATPSATANGHAKRTGVRLAACVLLAGGLKPSPLTAASGTSVLDLLVGPDETLLEHWVNLLAPLLDRSAGAGLRVIHCEATPTPAAPSRPAAGSVAIHMDRNHFRGPAGVARDTCADLHDEDHVLIAEGARLLSSGVAEMVAEHSGSDADITVAANADGTPAGLYLARCSTMGIVPKRGFMDLKEQWLHRAVERGMRVRVFVLPAPGAMPLRTRAQFLRACFSKGKGGMISPWLAHGITRGVLVRGRVSNLISGAASVDQGALIAHSVVMAGARIDAGALVARSIVCPGARIGAGEQIVDAVVTARGVQSDGEGSPRGSKEQAR